MNNFANLNLGTWPRDGRDPDHDAGPHGVPERDPAASSEPRQGPRVLRGIRREGIQGPGSVPGQAARPSLKVPQQRCDHGQKPPDTFPFEKKPPRRQLGKIKDQVLRWNEI